jgi:hypothetical protein
MLKRDELANPKSCLNQAADDEPIFTLRANDELAASIVRSWAGHYHFIKATEYGLIDERQRAKYNDALQLADQMDAWRKSKGMKT